MPTKEQITKLVADFSESRHFIPTLFFFLIAFVLSNALHGSFFEGLILTGIIYFLIGLMTTAALWSVTLAHLLRHLIVHTNREPVLLLLDEIGTAPPVAGLVEKLNTIRSRKMPTWLYWQSLEQMRVYGGNGVDGRSLILGACDLQMVFRLNDNESAQWMSDRIGTVEWRLRSVTHDGGLFSGGTASDSLSTEPAVRPHELQRLGRGEVVTAYRHLVWKGRAKPYYERGNK